MNRRRSRTPPPEFEDNPDRGQEGRNTTDELLHEIFSWIEQKELCALKLRELAEELESLRENCTKSEVFGDTVSVVGAACLIGAGAATLLTGGAAAPLFIAGLACSGVGGTVKVATKLSEHFISSRTMKSALKLEEMNNQTQQRIKELLQRIMTESENRTGNRMGNRTGNRTGNGTGSQMGQLNMARRDMIITAAAEAVLLLCFQINKEDLKLLPGVAMQVFKQVASNGRKVFGGVMVVGGVVDMAFTLPEAIKKWTDMINKNNVTEASQSLRDTSDELLKSMQRLRNQLQDENK